MEIINGVKCLGFAEVRIYSNGKHVRLHWFECPYCGTKFKTRKIKVANGHTRSCGCLSVKASCANLGVRKLKYNSDHPLYSVLHGILKRCGYRKGATDSLLRRYRDRGIDVYAEWVQDADAFIDFCIANGWNSSLQVDRKDNNKGYYPDNVHFVTPRENTRNREITVRLADGRSLADYAETVGIEVCRNGRITNEYTRLYRHFKQGHLLTSEDLANYPVNSYI